MNSDSAIQTHRSAARWAVLAGSTVLGFAIAEFGARVLELAPPTRSLALDSESSVYQRSSNPVLGFEMKASYRNESPNYVASFPFTNSHGQRDVERTVAKPPGVRRVLVLGDSVVEGVQVRELADTIPGQLERLYGGTTEVLNFGISGYCTLAEIELLETKGLAFAPDVVVVVFVENDFDNFNTQLTDLAVREPDSRLAGWLFHHSDLVRAAALRFGWFGITPPEDPFDRTREAIGAQNVVDGLERLRALADREGFVPLLGVWPHFAEDAIADPHPIDDGSGDLVVERLAAAFAIPSFRFSEPFREHFAALEGVTPRAFYTTASDTMHPTPTASAIAARALMRWIEQAGREAPRAVGEIDAAALELSRVKGAREPERFKLHVNIGASFERAGDHARAIAEYERALEEEMSPGWEAIIHYNLGNAARGLGDIDRARAEYTRAFELRPDQTPAKRRLEQLDAASRQEIPE